MKNKILKLKFQQIGLIPVCFLLMSYTATNCSQKLADRDCPSCVKADIQKLMDNGRCKEAKEKSGTQFPELKAMANLCLGAPSLSCLLGASSTSSSNNTNFIVAASSCASGATSLLVEAIDSRYLSDSNTALALLYLFIESVSAGTGCTDNASGGCTLGGNFTDARLQQLNDYGRKDIIPASAITALKKCSNDYCTTITEYALSL